MTALITIMGWPHGGGRGGGGVSVSMVTPVAKGGGGGAKGRGGGGGCACMEEWGRDCRRGRGELTIMVCTLQGNYAEWGRGD